jgi:hypothetical protein
MSEMNRNKKNLRILAYRTEGQASLEFTLIIPFLILIILTVSHFGLLVYQKNILEQAAREGARVIATANSNQEAYRCIRKVCSNLDQDKLDIKITPEGRASRKVGDMIEVALLYKCTGIARLLEIFSGRDISIKVKSNMRMECY